MAVTTWPVEGGWRTGDGFGPRSGFGSNYHRGIDIRPGTAGTFGQNVVAAGDGRITGVYNNNLGQTGGGGYGRYIDIQHNDGTSTRYAHLGSANVRVGDTVSAGDKIGTMGSTGTSNAPHLHFERRDANGARSKMFDNDELNERTQKRTKGDGDDKSKAKEPNDKDKDKGKEGNQEGNKDTDEKNKNRDKEQKPPKPTDKKDIQGTTNNYQETTMKTIASRLPTHEPWIGHPKTTEGPRQGVQESGSQNNGGGTGNAQGGGGSGSGSGGGSGGGSGSGRGSGGGSSGTSTNPGGSGSGNDNIPTGNAGAGGSYNQGQWDKSQYIYDRYRQSGYSHEVASAAVGNGMWESRLNNNNNTGDGGKAHGIFQWNDRAPALKRYAAAQGKDWTDFKTQVDFSLAELDGSAKKYGSNETRAGNLLRNQNLSQDEATHLFANTYERPAGSNARDPMGGNPHGNDNRKKLAREFSSKIKGRKPKTADPGANEKAQDSAPKPAEAKPSSGTSAAPATSADGLNS